MRPPIATGNIAEDLCRLTEYLDSNGHEAAKGLLGGEWGYGAEYVCDVFEMHPYWWGECECGFDVRMWMWESEHPHAADCYQSVLTLQDPMEPEKLAKEWGLPRFGCMVHCTCGTRDARLKWLATDDHEPGCPEVRPNFWHKPSGLEIRWYKYLARDMEFSFEPSDQQWADIFSDCIAAVKAS